MLGFEVFFFCNPGGFLMAVAASFLVSGYSGLYAKQKFAFSKTASPEGLAHEARRESTPILSARARASPAGAAPAGLRLGSEPTDENLIFC